MKKYNKLMILSVLILLVVCAIVVVQAQVEEEVHIDTREDENSLLDATIGQEQVNRLRYEKLKEERIERERLEKERLERERAQQLAEENEKKRLAEEKRKAEEIARLEKQKEQKNVQVTSNKEVVSSTNSTSNRTNLGTFRATAYTAYDGTQVGITRGGTNMANGNIHTASGHRILAADPNVIPFGSIVRVTLSSGEVIIGKIDDTGGAIKGNIIDISFSSKDAAFAFGRQSVQVEIIN